MYHISSRLNSGKNDSFKKKYFFESIPFDKNNPNRIRSNRQKNKYIDGIENKLTSFKVFPETEVACKDPKPLFKTQYSEILVEYVKGFDLKTGNLIIDAHLYQNREDEKSYIPVTLCKIHPKIKKS